MKTFCFETTAAFPAPLETVFAFFSDAHNLEAITPPWLHFEILTPGPLAIRAGAVIDYRLKVHGLPMRWRTEITVWEPPRHFIDAQRRGPYRLWIHEHHFEEKSGGTLASDRVRYAVRGGRFFHWLFVKRDVARIFAFRQKKLHERFGGDPAAQRGNPTASPLLHA